VHPLKESVTVMLENHALVEVMVSELISTKTAAGHSCSTCGGCTTKRRASAEEDNARTRDANKRRGSQGSPAPASPVPVGPVPSEEDLEEELGETGIDTDAAPGTGPADSPRRKRRRRNRNRNDKGGEHKGGRSE
jgi:hypothetical protein